MTMTTSNAKAIIKEWREQGCDIYLEALLNNQQPKAGYSIRFMPGYDGRHYENDALLLFVPPAKARKEKRIKSRDAVINLAEKHQIKTSCILWRER